jgi:hypothetical protein
MFDRSRQNLARWFTLSMGSILLVFVALLYLRETRDRLSFFDQTLYNTSRMMAAGVEESVYQGHKQIDLENVPLLGSGATRIETDLLFARWYSPDKQLLQFIGSIPPEQLSSPSGFETLVGEKTEQSNGRLRQLTYK